MYSSKAVQILNSFSPEEMKKFRDFVNSPYHNTNKTLCKLFDLLKKEYPSFDEKKISKEKLYPKLFTGKKYNEQVMKNLSSDLLQLALNFLAIEKYTTHNFYDIEIEVLNQLRERKLDPIFNKKWKELEKELADSTLMIHPLFYHLHRIETEKTKFHISRDEQALVADKVLKTGDYLIYYFITELSRIAIDIHSNIHAFNVVHEKNLVHKFIELFDFGSLIKFLQDNNYEYNEMLTIYYYRLASVLYDKDEDYFKFRDLLNKNLHLFSDLEKAGLLLSLEQCSIHRNNHGKKGAVADQFNTTKKMVETGIYRNVKKNISLMNFRNIIQGSILLKETGWAENFIKENIDLVNPLSRDNIYAHSMGIINYCHKDYDSALEYFSKVSLENPFYASDIKSHTAIIFYEQGHYDSVLSVLDSFRHIITNRGDFSPVFKEVNLHFINTLTSLIKLRFKEDKQGAVKLKEKLNTYGMVNHKNVLRKKIEEFIG